MRYLVIVNPATRRPPRRILKSLSAACPPGITLDVHVTTGPRTAGALARQHLGGVNAVIVVGGDGTVGEVASVVMGTEVPLGIIPAGSTNIVAQELGIPMNVRRAINVIFTPWHPRVVDVGMVGQHCFLHMAGAGVDSRMFSFADPRLKRWFGWMAYVPAGGRALLEAPATFDLEIDGQHQRVVSPLVLIANGGSIITPRIKLMPRLSADDGWLDVLIFRATSVRPLMRTLLDMGIRRLDTSAHVEHRRAKVVKISSVPGLPVQLDGDIVTTTPFTVEIAASSLSVIAPLKTHSRLWFRR